MFPTYTPDELAALVEIFQTRREPSDQERQRLLTIATMVGVVQLYGTDPADVLCAFSYEELGTIVAMTNPFRPFSVEDLYATALRGHARPCPQPVTPAQAPA